VIAPDTPGNGDSDAAISDHPDMVYYGDIVLELANEFGLYYLRRKLIHLERKTSGTLCLARYCSGRRNESSIWKTQAWIV